MHYKVNYLVIYSSTTLWHFVYREGGKPGSTQRCSVCNGRGIKVTLRQLGPGMVQQMQSVCPECRGEGLFSVHYITSLWKEIFKNFKDSSSVHETHWTSLSDFQNVMRRAAVKFNRAWQINRISHTNQINRGLVWLIRLICQALIQSNVRQKTTNVRQSPKRFCVHLTTGMISIVVCVSFLAEELYGTCRSKRVNYYS